MSEDRWPIAKPQSYSQKIKVESLIVEQITKQSQKCKPAADILLKNMDELVEILVQCFENSPENALADYVWKFIKKDSKFVEIKCLLFDVASVLECNRQNIINTKLNLSATKSVGFSTPSSSESNFNQNLNMELVLPNKIVESEDEEEDESETEMHICRPRGFSYYSKFVSTKKSVTPPQNVERSSDEYSLDSDNEESSDVTPESQDRFEKNTVFSKNEEDDSDEDIPRFLPRNLDRYKSSASTSKQPVIRRSVFDHISDDEDIPSDRRKDIIFDEKIAADNERVPKIYDPHSGNTKRSALQPHETIDYENQVNMEGPNPSRLLTAFPNQIGPCRKPECFVLEQWIPMTDYDDHINSAFSAFKNSEYVTDLNKKCPEHLFIFDSMMSGIPFESTYKNVECIDCGFPNNPLNIIHHLKTEIDKKRTDYIIKNVFICIGLDFLTYDPDGQRARKLTTAFFEKFLNLIVKAFDPKNGPKRYKRVIDKSFIDENCFLDVIPPKLIFITIPQVKGTQSCINLNNDIIQMNKHIRLFVNNCKAAAEKKRVILDVYDWEKSSANYDQCNVEHLGKRNGILMKYLSIEHALLMYPPDE